MITLVDIIIVVVIGHCQDEEILLRMMILYNSVALSPMLLQQPLQLTQEYHVQPFAVSMKRQQRSTVNARPEPRANCARV